MKLADYAAKGMLKAIAVPSTQEEARRTLLRRRHMMVDSVRRCKQRTKGLILFLGIDEPDELENWSHDFETVLLHLPMDPAARLTLESYLRELTFSREELRRVELQLKSVATSPDLTASLAYLQSVPGVVQVVLARRLAIILWRLCTEQRMYRASLV